MVNGLLVWVSSIVILCNVGCVGAVGGVDVAEQRSDLVALNELNAM